MNNVNLGGKMSQETCSPGTCCPEFDPAPWNEKELAWKDEPFVKDRVTCLFRIPLNFGGKLVKNVKRMEAADAVPPRPEFMVLSHCDSLWGMDIYIRAKKDVPGLSVERLSGIFLTKVFEGPFQDTGKWIAEMKKYVVSRSREMKDLFLYYTTCPKCARKFGKNYVVLLAKTS
jgi:hypothetical protein